MPARRTNPRYSIPMAKKSTKKPTRKASAKKPPKHYAQRSDFGAPADAYYTKISPPPLQSAAKKLRNLINRAAPKSTEALKWGMPMWDHHGMLCYIRAARGFIRFGFCNQPAGTTDPEGLLGGKGKTLRSIRITKPADINAPFLTRCLKQAVAENAKN